MIVVARRVHSRYPLVLVANRDEVLSRPTEPLHEWAGIGIVAGRDVTAGGTWLAAAPGGGIAAVTNVREPEPAPAELSRGELPVSALTSDVPVTDFARSVVADLDRYGPVNVLAGDPDEMWWCSNRSTRGPLQVGEGIHGLSNAALDTPWPKVTGAVAEVRALLGTDVMEKQSWSESILDVLADRSRARPALLPRTGVPRLQEWQLSSRFIRIRGRYGTRSTTVVRVDEHGRTEIVERTWGPQGHVTGTVSRSV